MTRDRRAAGGIGSGPRAWVRRHPRARGAARAVRSALRRAGWRRLRGSHWDRLVGLVESEEPVGWLDWEIVEREYVRPQVSGDPRVHYLKHFVDTHLRNLPVARGLSLGCGGGNLERALCDLAVAREIDACDASPESIRLADSLARDAGLGDRIHYRVADANRLELPPATYDFAIAKMSLHHLENLEEIYERIRRALVPGGLFALNEFVGPSRFQWSDLQLDLMNRMLDLLPPSLRGSVGPIRRLTVEEMIEIDPTEAIRSDEILPLLKRGFEIVEYKPYGGALLHVLLTHTLGRFDLDDPDQLALLRSLFLIERTLVEQGLLPSDFAYVVARPR